MTADRAWIFFEMNMLVVPWLFFRRAIPCMLTYLYIPSSQYTNPLEAEGEENSSLA